MHSIRIFGLIALCATRLCASSAVAATVNDTFDGGTSSAGWSFGLDTFESTGGDPGAWLHAIGLDTFGPRVACHPNISSAFTGDLRAKGVTAMSIDARIDHTDFPIGGPAFSMTLLLRNARGTPDDFSDDDFAYYVGDQLPVVGSGWKHFDFPVPSSQTTLPPGWIGGSADDPEHFRNGVTWNDIITHVDIVEFDYLDPRFVAIFQQWDTGVDNVSVTSIPEPASLAVITAISGLMIRLSPRHFLRGSGASVSSDAT